MQFKISIWGFKNSMPLLVNIRRRILVLTIAFHKKLIEVGITATLKYTVLQLEAVAKKIINKKNDVHPFDLKYGTDTSGIIRPIDLNIPEHLVQHAGRYQSGIMEVFLDILMSFSISFQEFIFIDLGSGKGRALLLASLMPFKKIIGIELSSALHRIACENIRIFKEEKQQCGNIESVCGDVSEFELPDEKTIFYMFNPFDEYVMRSLSARIENSLIKSWREIYVAYLKPVYRSFFDSSVFFEVMKETERYVIYKSKKSS